METLALYARRIESRIAESLQDTPVALLAGPRQAGKTTLVRQIAADNGLRYPDRIGQPHGLAHCG